MCTGYPIPHLPNNRRSPADDVEVDGGGAVAADHLGAGIRAKPVGERVAQPVGKQVDGPVGVQVDQDGAVVASGYDGPRGAPASSEVCAPADELAGELRRPSPFLRHECREERAGLLG
jgi:hypothetical protein